MGKNQNNQVLLFNPDCFQRKSIFNRSFMKFTNRDNFLITVILQKNNRNALWIFMRSQLDDLSEVVIICKIREILLPKLPPKVAIKIGKNERSDFESKTSGDDRMNGFWSNTLYHTAFCPNGFSVG